MDVYVGTSGFSYDKWKGGFYPKGLKADQRLQHYATQLEAVEVNNTFYRMPRSSVLERWRGEVPERFRFAIKASNKITHRARLKDADDSVAYLLQQLVALEDKLGAVLFQLPPSFKKDVERLRAFLKLVPGRLVTLEFRHASWFDDEVYEALREAGAALCVADIEDGLEVPLVETAPWGYVRLRRASYPDDLLEGWAERIRGASWERAYVFFKHDEGEAPALAARFRGMLAG